MADFNLGTSLTQNWDARGRVFYTDENGNKVDLNTPFLERVGNRLRKGFGAALQGASFLPIFNVPYVGTGLGGAMFEAGNAIREGRPGEDIAKDAAKGFVIGETVGAIPYVGKGINKLSGGKIGNVVDDIGRQLANTKAGQTVTNYAKQAETSLNNAIEKAEDFINTKFKNKQIAYHGSPYDFNKFSNEAIGTGEGAQAHGYGHYAAKSKDVADSRYRNNLVINDIKYKYNGKEYDRFSEDGEALGILYHSANKDDAINTINSMKRASEKGLNRPNISEDARQSNLEQIARRNRQIEIINNIEKKDVKMGNTGQLYKLSIPKDDVMLREDLPFSQQPIKVQENFKKLYSDYSINPDADYSLQKIIEKDYKGKDLYNILVHQEINKQYPFGTKEYRINRINPEFEKNASNLLNQHGIKGISYNGGIDGEARVIFNPDDIELVRKYYNQPNLYDYLMKNSPNIGAATNAIEEILRNPVYPMGDGFKNYEKLGLDYYKNNLQPNPVEIEGYGTVHFGKHNRGKDDITNFRVYPDIREQLMNATRGERTNYNDEADRMYDYFYNTYKGDLYKYLVEDIEGMGKRYKKMRNMRTNK